MLLCSMPYDRNFSHPQIILKCPIKKYFSMESQKSGNKADSNHPPLCGHILQEKIVSFCGFRKIQLDYAFVTLYNLEVRIS